MFYISPSYLSQSLSPTRFKDPVLNGFVVFPISKVWRVLRSTKLRRPPLPYVPTKCHVKLSFVMWKDENRTVCVRRKWTCNCVQVPCSARLYFHFEQLSVCMLRPVLRRPLAWLFTSSYSVWFNEVNISLVHSNVWYVFGWDWKYIFVILYICIYLDMNLLHLLFTCYCLRGQH